jgi:hypothetical protein
LVGPLEGPTTVLHEILFGVLKMLQKAIFDISMAVTVNDTVLWKLGLSDCTASHPEEDFFSC